MSAVLTGGHSLPSRATSPAGFNRNVADTRRQAAPLCQRGFHGQQLSVMEPDDYDSPVVDDEVEPLSFRARTARVLALLAVLVIVGLWGWALFFPPSDTPPATLKDRTFPDAAEAICTSAAEQLAPLPKSYATKNPIERSEVIAKTDVILNGMLDQLNGVALPADANEASNITEWLADWRTYVGDRATYATALQTDPSARFYVSVKEKQQITKPIDFFATMNKMYNCVTPDDIE